LITLLLHLYDHWCLAIKLYDLAVGADLSGRVHAALTTACWVQIDLRKLELLVHRVFDAVELVSQCHILVTTCIRCIVVGLNWRRAHNWARFLSCEGISFQRPSSHNARRLHRINGRWFSARFTLVDLSHKVVIC